MVAYESAQKTDISIKMTVFIVSALMLAGTWTRFSGLGERPLALDEYYFVKSVENIIEFGVPRFSTGGYYTRGIFLQYLTAISISVFEEGHFAYRFPAAIFGVGTILMAYFLGRQFLSRSWSIVLVAMLTLSSWEIEFSRFARMYSGFQFFSVCFFWSLYRYSFNKTSRKRYLAIMFAAVATLTHALSIFLALMLFLPLLSWINRSLRVTLWEQWVYVATSTMVLGIGLFQARFSFRYFGVSDRLPIDPDYVSAVDTTPHWFLFGEQMIGKLGFLSIATLVATGLAVFWTVYAIRNPKKVNGEDRLLGSLMVFGTIFGTFYQFTISILTMIIVSLRKPALFLKRPYTYVLALLAVVATLWFSMLFFEPEWVELAGGGNSLKAYLRSIRLAFFAFPDLYLPVINDFIKILPVLSALLGISFALQIIYIRKLPLASIVSNPVVPIILIIIGFGFQPPLRGSTRYILFLYPLALCIVLLSAARLGEALSHRIEKNKGVTKLLPVAICLIAFSMSEDFQPFYLARINSDAVSYRTGKYAKYEAHWYPRFDFKRPAELLNFAAASEDRIIVSSTVHTLNAYLKREAAVYWPWEDIRFAIISRERGRKELWSGNPILSRPEHVFEYAKHCKRLWIVILNHERDPLRIDFERLWPGRVKNMEVFTPGREKRIEVWNIEMIEG